MPYVYEKPPREGFQDFKGEIKKMMAEIKAKLAEEEKLKIEKGEKIEDAEDKEEDPEDKPISKMEDTRFKKSKKDKKKDKKKKKKGDPDGSGEEDNGERSDDEDFEGG